MAFIRVGLGVDDSYKVPLGYKVRINSGALSHVTGTSSNLVIKDRQDNGYGSIIKIDTATASGDFVLNDRVGTNNVASMDLSQLWIPHLFRIHLATGGTGAVVLLFLEIVEDKPMKPLKEDVQEPDGVRGKM